MWALEVWNRYLNWLPSYIPLIATGAVVAVALVAQREKLSRPVKLGVLAAVLPVGLWQVWQRLSLVDDAFISLRYAKNLLAGQGLVYNPGEAVLGMTNFGWTLCLAVFSGVSGVELPHAALLFALCGYLGLITATWRVSDALTPEGTRWPPLAAIGVAVSWLTTSFASTGLESLSVAALVIFGLDAVLRGRWATAGLFLTVATTFRLDQGLFLAIGAIVALRHGEVKRFLFASPLLAAMLAWCTWSYGHPLPNTFAAKASGAYFSMGGFYLWTFLLTTQLLWLVPFALAGLVQAPDPTKQRFRLFVGLGLVLWPTYVGYVGGDFMIGRFLLVLIPLLLLSAEKAMREWVGTGQLVAAAALGATAFGLPILHPKSMEWWLADEGSIYGVKHVVPFEMKHHTYKLGLYLNEILVQRGYEPTIAAHGIGMIGYYSELPIVDILGLTDSVTANMELPERGRPGHERHAPRSHLLEAGAVLTSVRPFKGQGDLTRLHVDKEHRFMGHWHMLRYEPAVVERLREVAPELKFLDIEKWLASFVAQLDERPTRLIRMRLEALESYYFNQPGAKLHFRKAIRDHLAEREAAEALEAIGYVSGQEPAAEQSGVMAHEASATGGLNLISSAHGSEALLIDMSGAVRHRWSIPFAEAFPAGDASATGAKTLRRVRVFDNGDLLGIFEGIGLVKVDRDSEILWAQANRAHHDVAIADDGHLWALTRSVRKQTPYGRPLIEDFVVELDADGRELQRHSVLEAVLNGTSRPALDALIAGGGDDPIRVSEVASGDVLHTNAIHVISRDAGPLKKGHLLLSSRVLSSLWAMDPKTGAIVWTTRGDFDGQHDPAVMEDGSVLLFDNGADQSRVLRINAAGGTAWSWSRDGLFSKFCGSVQSLEGGQVLLTESLPGRAIQIDMAGNVVWEWHNPHRAIDDPSLTANLYAVERLAEDYGEGWLAD
ncbi:MAG: aryl-sulfate sulfotransferase [Proteobacteria bacterium]|nr:aryl-sulfate sulfotransferase [Pseudomonadota bacterium]